MPRRTAPPNPDRIDAWMEIYVEELHKAVKAAPEEYPWARPEADGYPERLQKCLDNMRRGFEAGTYSNNGHAVKHTAARLGIKSTYTAIDNYLTGA